MLVSHFLSHFFFELFLLFQVYLSRQIPMPNRSFHLQLLNSIASHHFIDFSLLLNFPLQFHFILYHHLGSQYFVCLVSDFPNLPLALRLFILQKSNSVLNQLRLKFILFVDCCEHAKRGGFC